MKLDEVRRFRETHFGWLRPDGLLVACALFDHLGVLGQVPEMADAVATYAATVDENEQAMAEALASLGPDDHPEMHRFDGMNDDARERLTRSAYVTGWVRLGLHLDRSAPLPSDRRAVLRSFINDPSNWVVEAEGFNAGVDLHRNSLEELAALVDAKLNVRRLDY